MNRQGLAMRVKRANKVEEETKDVEDESKSSASSPGDGSKIYCFTEDEETEFSEESEDEIEVNEQEERGEDMKQESGGASDDGARRERSQHSQGSWCAYRRAGECGAPQETQNDRCVAI